MEPWYFLRHGPAAAATNMATDEALLTVDSLKQAADLAPLSLTLHKGEILGIAGLVGAGRTEFVRAIFGADKPVGAPGPPW